MIIFSQTQFRLLMKKNLDFGRCNIKKFKKRFQKSLKIVKENLQKNNKKKKINILMRQKY